MISVVNLFPSINSGECDRSWKGVTESRVVVNDKLKAEKERKRVSVLIRKWILFSWRIGVLLIVIENLIEIIPIICAKIQTRVCYLWREEANTKWQFNYSIVIGRANIVECVKPSERIIIIWGEVINRDTKSWTTTRPPRRTLCDSQTPSGTIMSVNESMVAVTDGCRITNTREITTETEALVIIVRRRRGLSINPV